MRGGEYTEQLGRAVARELANKLTGKSEWCRKDGSRKDDSLENPDSRGRKKIRGSWIDG